MHDCPICKMKIGDRFVMSPLAPSMFWLETIRAENGYIQQRFGYGDDPNDSIIYCPTYCPECGSKIEKVTERSNNGAQADS